MTTTLLPFLYQTKTLQRLPATTVSTRAFRSLLHSSAQCHGRQFIPSPRPRRLDRRKPEEDAAGSIPFELPEGYVPPSQANPWVEEDPETGLRSTITPSECDTFSRIFEEIAAKKTPESLSTVPPSEGAASSPSSQPTQLPPVEAPASPEVDDFTLQQKYPSASLGLSTISVILQDAAEKHSKATRSMHRPYDPLHPLGQASASTEWEKALARFPPSLRKAAQMALGVGQADRQAQGSASRLLPVNEDDFKQKQPSNANLALNPLAMSIQNEALRRDERNRVEAKMREAKTDFELWDVLEEEVFPMVQKLGLDEEGRSKRKRGSNKKNGKKGDEKLPMHIYGPLYPAYLLTALRFLDRNFATSSPLALHLLPRVKELGLVSYILGISTPFYNELARIQWRRYGNPTAVLNLLEEMRAAGLYLDESTRGLVISIQKFMRQAENGNWGPFLGELIMLPQYEGGLGPRVAHWLKSIQGSIQDRKIELKM